MAGRELAGTNDSAVAAWTSLMAIRPINETTEPQFFTKIDTNYKPVELQDPGLQWTLMFMCHIPVMQQKKE